MSLSLNSLSESTTSDKGLTPVQEKTEESIISVRTPVNEFVANPPAISHDAISHSISDKSQTKEEKLADQQFTDSSTRKRIAPSPPKTVQNVNMATLLKTSEWEAEQAEVASSKIGTDSVTVIKTVGDNEEKVDRRRESTTATKIAKKPDTKLSNQYESKITNQSESKIIKQSESMSTKQSDKQEEINEKSNKHVLMEDLHAPEQSEYFRYMSNCKWKSYCVM